MDTKLQRTQGGSGKEDAVIQRLFRYIRTKFFKKKSCWVHVEIDWDEITKDAAQRLSDQIDIDVLDNVYKQVEESARYWAMLKEKEIRLQIRCGKVPKIQEWPMFSHEVILKGVPHTQVVSQCVIGETKIRLDTNFKA
jgi:hypothetical protein